MATRREMTLNLAAAALEDAEQVMVWLDRARDLMLRDGDAGSVSLIDQASAWTRQSVHQVRALARRLGRREDAMPVERYERARRARRAAERARAVRPRGAVAPGRGVVIATDMPDDGSGEPMDGREVAA